MPANDDARLREVLLEAAELPPERRAEFLDVACAGDVERIREVQSLLFQLDGQVEEAATPCPDVHPQRIGRYRILDVIGEGGMGTVYRAEQRHPVRRMVALKLIKLGMDTRQVVARFDAERQALALMDHANVAKVFDAGATDTGRPYFVMELVAGVPVTSYCDDYRLTVRQRLELFVIVCGAVQHAHTKGIIHRDLKPANVLVTQVDGRPVPKVIDFGIAKATSHPLTDLTLFTRAGGMMGTVDYMSPEQATSGGIDVDTRADIYSLGVILYELLTGMLPFDGGALRRDGPDGVGRILREVDPPAPSVRLCRGTSGSRTGRSKHPARAGGGPGPSAGHPPPPLFEIARRRRRDPQSLRKDIRGDLDWIITKAMEKNRARRYETASALAADVGRHLNSEPVLARPHSTRYLVGRFARRHKLPLLGATVVAAALVLGIIGTGMGLRRARAEATTAVAVQKLLEKVLASAEESGGADASIVEVLDRADLYMDPRINSDLANKPEVEMRARFALRMAYWNLGYRREHLENLQRAYQLVRQTHSEQTRDGLRIMIAVVDTGSEVPGREELARESLGIARRVYGHDELTGRASVALAVVLRKQGRNAEAVELLRREAEAYTRRPLPAGGAPFYELGRTLWNQRDFVGAEQLMRKAYEEARKKQNQKLPNRQSVTVGRSLAQALLRLGKPEEALKVLQETFDYYRQPVGDTRLSLNGFMGDYATALRRAGREEEATKRLADAHASLESMVSREAKGLSAVDRRALGLAHLGRFAEASREFARCLDEDPTDEDAWILRACLLAYTGKRDAYVDHCRRMLAQYRDTSDWATTERCLIAWFLLPRTADECREVMPLVDRQVAGNRRYEPFARFVKGLAAYRAGEFGEAVQWLEKAREIPPPLSGMVASTDLLLGMSRQRLGDAAAADTAFARAKQVIDAEVPPPESGVIIRRLEDQFTCHALLKEAQALRGRSDP